MHHLQDRAILRRAHGLKQIAAVQHTKPAKPNKRSAIACGDAAAPKFPKEAAVTAQSANAAVYSLGIQSPIAALQPWGVSSKTKRPMPPGTNRGIPLDRQKYCEFCHKWAVDYQGHLTGQRHNENVKAAIRWFWCYTCNDNVLTTDKESHVCQVN